MSDEQLFKLKRWSDKTMYNNYYRYRKRHPYILFRDYIYKAKRLIGYIKVNGIKRTILDSYVTLKNNPELIFQAE